MTFSYRITNRKERFLLIGLMLIVLLVSASIVLFYNDYFLLGDPNNPNNDDVKYIQSAKLLLNEGILAYNTGVEPSAFIMPGFPLILSGFMAIFGQDGAAVIAFRLFQCLLQAGSLYLVFIIARYAFNTRIAFIACILSALYLPDYFSSGVILSETIFRTLILVLVCVTISAVQARKYQWYILIGALVAFAAYFKPHASLYPAILLILWLRARYSWKEMLRYTFIIGSVYVILLMPWWIRNMITFNEFILFTNSGGSPFLLGTSINYNMPPAGFFDAYPQYDPKTIFDGSDSAAVAKGLDIVKYGFTHEPLTYLHWYTIGKLQGLYLDPYYWKPIWPISKEVMIWIQYALMALAAVGIVISRIWKGLRERWRMQEPIVLTLLYFTVIYVPFVAFSRYGYPNIVFLLMFSAVTIEWGIQYVRSIKQGRSRSKSTVDGS
jgi:4-amino-4-deoxy-L-arabinose transferase-like glycosyltransferase